MDKKFQSPDEFRSFSEQFYSHILDDIETEEELFAFATQVFRDPSKRDRLRAYLNEITSERYSAADLKKLWWSSPADTIFHDGEELRTFLRKVRDRL